MSNYNYVTSVELYNRLKAMLRRGVNFSEDINSSNFAIISGSKILGIKDRNKWYVNIGNWGVSNPQILHNLGIRAITPGAYSLKLISSLLRKRGVVYDKKWPKLSNDINSLIKSGYNSGLLYSKPGFYNQKMYHYDINAAFAQAFSTVPLPVGIPEIIPGYAEPEEGYLNIYYMDVSATYTSSDIFPYLVNSNDLFRLPSEIISDTGFSSFYKVITEVELKDVMEDYEIYNETLYTLKFRSEVGLFKEPMAYLHDLKERSEGEERGIWKNIMATLAGKFSQELDTVTIPKHVNEFEVVEFEVKRIPDADVSYLNPAVSLFIVDSVRKYMRDVIRRVGYKNIVMCDTDGFISKIPVDVEINENMGGWKVKEYDNVVINGPRSYFYTYLGSLHSSISGVGDIRDDTSISLNYFDLVNLYRMSKPLTISKRIMYAGQYKYVNMEIKLGENNG